MRFVSSELLDVTVLLTIDSFSYIAIHKPDTNVKVVIKTDFGGATRYLRNTVTFLDKYADL